MKCRVVITKRDITVNNKTYIVSQIVLIVQKRKTSEDEIKFLIENSGKEIDINLNNTGLISTKPRQDIIDILKETDSIFAMLIRKAGNKITAGEIDRIRRYAEKLEEILKSIST